MSSRRRTDTGDDTDDDSGLQMLIKHLAKVKLEFAERDSRHEYTIRAQHTRIKELERRLGAAESDVGNFKDQVQEMQQSKSVNWRVKQLTEWKTLAANLRKDLAKQKEESRRLRDQLSKYEPHMLSSSNDNNNNNNNNNNSGPHHDSASITDISERNEDSNNNSPRSRAGSDDTSSSSSILSSRRPSVDSTVGGSGGLQSIQSNNIFARNTSPEMHAHALLEEASREVERGLRADIHALRMELDDKSVEIAALKRKLDMELMHKWERNQQHNGGWKRSLFESFVGIIAPFPTDTTDGDDADVDAWERLDSVDHESTTTADVAAAGSSTSTVV